MRWIVLVCLAAFLGLWGFAAYQDSRAEADRILEVPATVDRRPLGQAAHAPAAIVTRAITEGRAATPRCHYGPVTTAINVTRCVAAWGTTRRLVLELAHPGSAVRGWNVLGCWAEDLTGHVLTTCRWPATDALTAAGYLASPSPAAAPRASTSRDAEAVAGTAAATVLERTVVPRWGARTLGPVFCAAESDRVTRCRIRLEGADPTIKVDLRLARGPRTGRLALVSCGLLAHDRMLDTCDQLAASALAGG